MDCLHVIASESQRLADVLASTEPDRSCPTCPDWTASDLLWHLTNVHFFWAGILARGVLDQSELAAVEQSKPGRPQGFHEVLSLREEATAALIEQLTRRADDEPCWSWWAPDQSVGFTRRMQTYEATMHRIDAELTAGVGSHPIPADVAAGAIDHAADVMWGWQPGGATRRTLAVVEFIGTDTDERWLVEVGEWQEGDRSGPVAWRAVAGDPAVAVHGSVEDLALWAWTRGGRVEVSGGPDACAALDAVLTQGMQ